MSIIVLWRALRLTTRLLAWVIFRSKEDSGLIGEANIVNGLILIIPVLVNANSICNWSI